jgi:integrase
LFPRIHRHDRISTKAIAPESINDTVKRAIERAGIDASRYGAHSLRAGAATASAELGRSDQEIMSLTGHKSAKVMQMYIRRSRVFSGRNPLEGLL